MILGLGAPELIIILLVVLVIFGPRTSRSWVSRLARR